VWYFDLDSIRALVREEKQIRAVTFGDIERETGVGQITVCNFLQGAGLATNSIVSLIRWSGKKVDPYIARRRNAANHSETVQERELRLMLGYLKSNGFDMEPGESVASAMIRHLSNAVNG
jgi:hypothetical protein